VIAVNGLCRGFGEFALGPVTFAARRGEYWVLLGPSGAGKSMLLHTIAGVFLPHSGTVTISGRDVTNAPPEARQVGLVFQQSALFPHLSVIDNIAYGLDARGAKAADRARRLDEVVSATRIESLLSRPVATLSGGEAQKVAIARALAIRPEALLLDEPLGPIDHNARLELQDELRRLHESLGLTTIHVTHSREEAKALADHVAVMLNGRVVQAGPVERVLSTPRCVFVAGFLGLDARYGIPACRKSCLSAPGVCDLPELP
jgi:ABC-type sugar transport system ATPase subunit